MSLIKTAEQSNRQLHQMAFDPQLTPGARNAVRVCLRVQASEKVTVITDEVSLEIAAALVRELEEVGCRYRTWVLEDVATRPLTDLPLAIAEDLESSQVSIFAVQAQTNELKSRMQLTDVVNRRKIRHAHMVNIKKRIMLEGMRADFQKVDRLSVKVLETVRKAKQIRAKTAAGTDLVADLNPSYRWVKTSGIISPEKWGNLPGGEVFTTPGEVNGTFVIDGVVGDYLCAKFGDLKANPLTIQVKANRVIAAHSANKELKDVIGEILQDEKYPGVHIAFGNPYGAHTGAEWYSSTHIDVVGRNFDIWVDGEQIMRGGQFLIEAYDRLLAFSF